MTEVMQSIPARLKNVAVGGHVAGADQIIDDEQNKTQETINSEVNTALGNKANKSEMSVTPGTGANVDKTTIQLKSGTSATVLTQHQDISGKQDTINDLATIRSGAAAGATAQQPATTLSGYGITDAYTKSETYTKTEVNGLVDTPHQEYVTVNAYSALPATGSKDTIYRVSNYNGSTSQVDASVYSEYAWNGSQYIFLCVKSQIGEVFDISVYNNNAKYTDLAAALNGGANIPQSLQKGGMSVKFVQSSDNKYVQYRLMSDSFNTTPANWQGVDDEPTVGSDNLVKSGGVAVSLFDTLCIDEVKSDVSLENNQAKFPFGDSFMPKNDTNYNYSVYLYGTTGKTVVIEFVNVETGNAVQSTGFVTIGDSGYIELDRTRFDLDLKIKIIANSTSGGVYTIAVKKTINPESLIDSTGIREDVYDVAFNGSAQTAVSLTNNQVIFPFGDALLKKTDSAIEYIIRLYGDTGKTVAITTVNLLTGNPIESTGLTTIGDEGYIELNSKRRDLDLKIQVTANSTSAGQYNVIVTKIDNTVQHIIQQEISNNVSVDDIKSSCLFSVKGFINAADGTVNTTNPTTVCTNFLAIDSRHYIKVYGLSGTVAALVAFYDNNKTFISALNGTSLNNTPLFIESSDIPANAAFIRVSGTVNQLNIANTGTLMEYPFNFKDSSLFTVEQKFVRYPDGELSNNPYFKCTNFIEYNGKGLMLNGAANDGNVALVAFYDASKTFISAIRGTEKNETDVILMPYQIPSNTKYFKVSCNINQNGYIFNGENLSDLVSRVNDKDKNNKIAYQFTGADYDVSRLNVQESFTLKDTLGIYADYDALVSSYPDYVSKIDCDAIMQTIGVERPSALDNIPMYMYKFEPQYAQVGVNHDGGIAIRPIKMFICTGTHDEPYAIQTAYNLLKKLCTSWNTDVNLEALRFNATIWVMPVGNPWAMMQPGRGDGGNIRVNYDGVDLNRNMDTSAWVAGTPGTKTYGGSEPNSEYESKVLAHMIGSVLPDIFIDFHNFGTDFVGNMIYYGPYDNKGKNIASELVSKMSRVLKKENADYVQDTTTMLGWIDPAIASTRGFYAYEHNVPLSLTMEVAAGSPWDNGVSTSRIVSSGTPILMSENVQIFAYTLLRLAYNLTIE